MTARRIFWPALIVALGAAAATAHGLYEVAVASRVPTGIAWLYPVITDGLALVAYAATRQLDGRAARYAWFVVVTAAGLSGLAQAVLLASDDLAAPAEVRFGIGAWPAIAAAVVAHLLYLLARDPHEAEEESGADVPAVLVDEPEPDWPEPRDWWANAAPVEQRPAEVLETAPLALVPEQVDEPSPVDLDQRAAELVASGAGRVWLQKELGITEHQAKTYVKRYRQEVNA